MTETGRLYLFPEPLGKPILRRLEIVQSIIAGGDRPNRTEGVPGATFEIMYRDRGEYVIYILSDNYELLGSLLHLLQQRGASVTSHHFDGHISFLELHDRL
jgi:hypothetical protein